MRLVGGFGAIALSTALCAGARASALTLVVPNQLVVVYPSAGQPQIALRAIWSDERLVADLDLDVYQVPKMKSTTQHYVELSKMSSKPRWIDDITWKLVRRDTGAPISFKENEIPSEPRAEIFAARRRSSEPSPRGLAL